MDDQDRPLRAVARAASHSTAAVDVRSTAALTIAIATVALQVELPTWRATRFPSLRRLNASSFGALRSSDRDNVGQLVAAAHGRAQAVSLRLNRWMVDHEGAASTSRTGVCWVKKSAVAC
jgi:hypothetical protein